MITNPTAAQLESQMVCENIRLKNCSLPYLVRYFSLQIWANSMYLYREPKLTGTSLPAYLDSIVKRARNFKSTLRLTNTYAQASGSQIYLRDYKKNWNNFEVASPRASLLLFNSSKLRVDCGTVTYSQSNGSFAWLNFTFILPKGSSPSQLKFNLNKATMASLKNG